MSPRIGVVFAKSSASRLRNGSHSPSYAMALASFDQPIQSGSFARR